MLITFDSKEALQLQRGSVSNALPEEKAQMTTTKKRLPPSVDISRCCFRAITKNAALLFPKWRSSANGTHPTV